MLMLVFMGTFFSYTKELGINQSNVAFEKFDQLLEIIDFEHLKKQNKVIFTYLNSYSDIEELGVL